MKILVLGCNGQLGQCLRDQLSKTNFEVKYTSRKEINISDFIKTKNKILEFCPDVVINAAAYTLVDFAEKEISLANEINHLAAANLASICRQMDSLLLHISTDYVFDGMSQVPYKESDITNPKTIYGKTKLNGELGIMDSGCRYIIIRTSWLFSEYGKNFLKTMLRIGSSSDEVSVIKDQIGCPTYAQDLAKSIITIINKINLREKIYKIYHYCGDQQCSWYDFAKFIFKEASSQNFKTPKLIKPINAVEYPVKLERPAYSVMDCASINHDFSITPSDWKLGVQISILNS